MQAPAPKPCLNLNSGRVALLPSVLTTSPSWSGFSCLWAPVLLTSCPGSSPELVASPGLELTGFCVALVSAHSSQDFTDRPFSTLVTNLGQGWSRPQKREREGLARGVQEMVGGHEGMRRWSGGPGHSKAQQGAGIC